VISFGAEEDTN